VLVAGGGNAGTLDDAKREADGLDAGGDGFVAVVAESLPSNFTSERVPKAKAADLTAKGLAFGATLPGSVDVATVSPNLKPVSGDSNICDAALLLEPNCEP
jgi:hypothetical protein